MGVGGGEWEWLKGSKKERGRTVPPRLSLSAGFTWMGLFICDGGRQTRGDTVSETAARHGGKSPMRSRQNTLSSLLTPPHPSLKTPPFRGREGRGGEGQIE